MNALAKTWYGSTQWQQRRALQLARQPLCVFCLARGHVTSASVADHKVPHRGDFTLFWYGDLQSLCAPCHSSDKQRMENGRAPRPRFGKDGWPL